MRKIRLFVCFGSTSRPAYSRILFLRVPGPFPTIEIWEEQLGFPKNPVGEVTRNLAMVGASNLQFRFRPGIEVWFLAWKCCHCNTTWLHATLAQSGKITLRRTGQFGSRKRRCRSLATCSQEVGSCLNTINAFTTLSKKKPYRLNITQLSTAQKKLTFLSVGAGFVDFGTLNYHSRKKIAYSKKKLSKQKLPKLNNYYRS